MIISAGRSSATIRAPSRSATYVRAHPLAAYLVIAYGLSWAYWLPIALGSRMVDQGVGWPTHLPGLLGPAISAAVVTACVDGREGLVDLWQRLTRWRVGWWWFSVVALLVAGAIGLAISGVEQTRDLTLYSGVAAGIGPLATIATVLLVNGVGEETGWRGFLADRLLKRHSLTTTSLLVALAWAPWHAPLFFLLDSFDGFSPARTVGWAMGLTAGSVVLTWLYRGSGASILLVAVWHTSFNFTSATPAGSGAAAAITSTIVMIAAVAIIVAGRRSPSPLGEAAARTTQDSVVRGVDDSSPASMSSRKAGTGSGSAKSRSSP
jgi:uncharacterized protein